MSEPVVFVPDPGAAAAGVAAAGGDLGRIASTLLSVTAAGAAEPGRLRRGRDSLADGAVLEIRLTAGLLSARVQGSAVEPYRVEVRVARSPVAFDVPADGLHRSHVTALVPSPRELVWWCTCRDPNRPCKHAIAALLGLAAELADRPDLLVLWRDGDAVTGSLAADAVEHTPHGTAGGAVAATSRRGLAVDIEAPHWRAYLGTDLPPPEAAPSAGEPPHGSLLVDGVDIGLAVRTAIAVVVNVLAEGPQ